MSLRIVSVVLEKAIINVSEGDWAKFLEIFKMQVRSLKKIMIEGRTDGEFSMIVIPRQGTVIKKLWIRKLSGIRQSQSFGFFRLNL